MDKNTVRIVKIDREALFEFLYENFVAQQEEILEVSAVECMNNFAIDWDKGAFLFAAHKAEDEEENLNPFPEDIDLKELLHRLPATSESVLSQTKSYRDYTFDELRKILKQGTESDKKRE